MNIRYDKLNALIHLQNQKAHYRRILEAKKNINFDHEARSTSQSQSAYGNMLLNKSQKYQERERKENNLKLVRKIQ